MNSFVDDFGPGAAAAAAKKKNNNNNSISNEPPSFQREGTRASAARVVAEMGRIEPKSHAYGSSILDSPPCQVKGVVSPESKLLCKMTEDPSTSPPLRRHRKPKYALTHVQALTGLPEFVVQFDVWSYFTGSHYREEGEDSTASDDYNVGSLDNSGLLMTPVQLADLLAQFNNLENKDRQLIQHDALDFGGGQPSLLHPPMNQLTMEEMADILCHINLCEETKSPIRYDVINRMIYPALEVERWQQPLGSIALNSESCVSSVSWEDSLSNVSSSGVDDDDFEDSSSLSVNSEFQDY